jgi:hypothetical protein
MKAERDDHIGEPLARSRFPVTHGLLVLLLIAGIGVAWWYTGQDTSTTPDITEAMSEAAPPPVATPRRAPPPAPDIPRKLPPAPVPAAIDSKPDTPPPPPEPVLLPAAEADAWLIARLAELDIPRPVLALFDDNHPLSVSTALLDGASRGILMRKLITGWSPARPFPVQGEGPDLSLDPKGYERYDTLVNTLVAVDATTAERAFHLLRPLYERAYGEIGLKPEDFDNALISALDQVIAAPVLERPPQLAQEKVLYTFADPELEALSPLHKQLVRMGPENTRRLQRHAQAVRAALLGEN